LFLGLFGDQTTSHWLLSSLKRISRVKTWIFIICKSSHCKVDSYTIFHARYCNEIKKFDVIFQSWLSGTSLLSVENTVRLVFGTFYCPKLTVTDCFCVETVRILILVLLLLWRADSTFSRYISDLNKKYPFLIQLTVVWNTF